MLRQLVRRPAAAVKIKKNGAFLRANGLDRQCFVSFSSAAAASDDLRVCVVGSGPGGFYAAKYLLKEYPHANVEMLEALPTPFGLVRSGVAPDHPEVKSVINDFEKVAADERFEFLGNVRVGEDISIQDLKDNYHAIILAYGAAGDRELGIPGEHLKGVLSARTFVNWYNGHPAFRDVEVNLETETAVIFGQGNVAVDCARILTKSIDELETTDISTHAVEVLKKSRIKNVLVVGRRGSAQAAFTMKEIRELTKLSNVSCIVDPEDMKKSLNESSLKEINEQRAKKRMNELLTKISDESAKGQTAERKVQIKFFASPIELLPDLHNPEKVGTVRVERTKLEGEPNHQRAVGTGEIEEIPCGLVLRSIGYKSHPIDGVPFDSRRHVLSNTQGRIVDPTNGDEPVTGFYCAGWVKRGPSGIIGTNIVDARETVSAMIEDIANNKVLQPKANASLDNVKAIIKQKNPTKQFVTWNDYERLNEEEVKRGETVGKPREKITSIEEMLKLVAAK